MYPKRPSLSTEKEVFPAFPRISPHCLSSAALSGKKRLFSLQTQKCRRGFLKFLPPADLPLPFPASFPFPPRRRRGGKKVRRRARTALPRRRRGRAGEKKRKYGERVRNKMGRERAKKCGKGCAAEGDVRWQEQKNGEKQQRRPQRFWGRLCRKKVAADGKPTERNAIKDRFYKNPCGKPSFLQAEPYGRQGFVRGIERARAEKAFATGQSLRTQQKSPKRRFGLFLRGRTDADPCKRRLLNALPRGRGFPSPDRRGKSRRCSPETPPFFTVIFTVCHRVF